MEIELGKIKKQYSSEFKRDAVALFCSSNRSIREVAHEIGVNDSTLGSWSKAEEHTSLDSNSLV